MDSKLTLEKAVKLSRESETIKKQQPLLRGQSEQQSADLGAVQTQRSRNQTGRRPNPQRGTLHKTSAATTGSCSRCGHSPSHDRLRCPARQARCRKCGRLGHFQAVCRSQSVGEISLGDNGDTGESDVFLGTVTDSEMNRWKVKLSLDDKEIEWRIDTGADVTAIPECLYQQLEGKPLLPCRRPVRGASQHRLQVKGKFRATLKKGDKQVVDKICHSKFEDTTTWYHCN